ncbi:NACHT domain-containing protein [Dictyobacter alpinus]|nr:NACHT domain-containing protein [Dictyobacter alpinus]
MPNHRLKHERERRYWTLEDVAQYINRLHNFGPGDPDPHMVEYWEQGITFPGPRYCQALCTIFQMDAYALGLTSPPIDGNGNIVDQQADQYRTVAYNEEEYHQHANYSTRAEIPPPPTRVNYNLRNDIRASEVPGQMPAAAPFFYTNSSIDNTVSRNIKSALLPQDKNNRQHLLKRVRRFWITDVLEHSLHHAALIELGFQTRPDALINPWHLLQEYAQAKRTLPPHTSIAQVYDDSDGALLILGEPGAGKTTLLLELTRHLLNRAEEDEFHLIPVVFNLSSWAIKRAPIKDWLVEELHDKYQVPRKIGQGWVENEGLLLLLDGLDEVNTIHRTACIDAINTFRRKYGLVPIVVCSRSAEYHTLSLQLSLQMAVVIQPLTAQQTERYLKTVGKPLEALRVALQQDLYLQELATTPLMLSVLALAYHGMPLDEILKNKTLEDKRQQIFATYVQRMLTRRGTSTSHPPAPTIQWLAYLARQMKHQNQSVFYIEHIQPDWLEEPRTQRIYERLAIQLIGTCIGILISLVVSFLFLGSMPITTRTIYALMGGLLGGLLSGRTLEPLPAAENATRPRRHWYSWLNQLITHGPTRNGLSVALITILIPGGYTWHAPLKGLVVGCSFGLTSMLLSVLLAPVSSRNGKKRTYNLLKQGILIGTLIGLSTGLSFGFLIGPIVGIGFGLIVGISFGLISLLLLLFFSQRSPTIQLTEIITWSPKSLLKGLFSTHYLKQGLLVSGLVGIGVGLSNALIFGPSVALARSLSLELGSLLALGEDIELIYRAIVGLVFGLSIGLSIGMTYCFILGLLNGLSNQRLEEHRRLTPNQGIGRSARNGLIVGVICTCASWSIHILMLFIFTRSYYLFSRGLGLLLSDESGQQLNILLDQGLNEVLSFGLHNALFIGPSCGLLVGLLIGGWACIQHIILRILLWRSGVMPWNYAQFLDFATERILLRKVGGGYIFVHRLLLDYFAALVPRQTTDPSTVAPIERGVPLRAQGADLPNATRISQH